jgi:hypothetical protein
MTATSPDKEENRPRGYETPSTTGITYEAHYLGQTLKQFETFQ